MPAPERFFTEDRKQKLTKAAHQRHSCRVYTGELSVGDWSALSYTAGRCVLPGARLVLMRVDETLFTGMVLGVGRITGCRKVAAVLIDPAEPMAHVHAGFIGEVFCLEAEQMGLGTCWVGGTYRKKQITGLPLNGGETLLCVIAVGTPAAKAGSEHRRKPLEHLTRGDISAWPQEYRGAAELVRIAPSAVNLQPWTMEAEENAFLISGADRSQTDLGIAMCHAELALTTPHRWRCTAERGRTLLCAERV